MNKRLALWVAVVIIGFAVFWMFMAAKVSRDDSSAMPSVSVEPSSAPTTHRAATSESTPKPRPTESTIMQVLSLGDTAVIASKPLPCFDSPDAIEPFLHAAIADDKTGEQEALADAVIASPGDRILMLDTSSSPFAIGAVRVRLTSGGSAGHACWLEGDLNTSALTHHVAKQ